MIGQSAPVTGTNQALGTGMKLGIELAFNDTNANGGIRGRQLQLDFRDDAYQPDLAEEAARALVDAEASPLAARCPSSTAMIAGNPPVTTTAIDRGPTAVLAFLGNVGTPTMVRAAPVAVESGTMFFGAFTGATTVLRDDTAGPCKKYIFNVRASYGEEAEATVEYFKNKGIVDFRTIISFDQNDSFGQAGYDGLTAAYNKNYGGTSGTSIQRFRYARNDDTSVPTLVTAAENYIMNTMGTGGGSVTFGVMMTDTYGAGAEFIAALRQWQFAAGSQQTTYNMATRLHMYFSNVSFVGPNDLSTRLVAAGMVQTPNGPMPMT
ncbi:MAG TPA: ABC transporter substrate-binding protein, partial [Kofleriaceae bacterium]|nr:ABC transporter substrate-binding protein [Kofleriaceae bacterium]